MKSVITAGVLIFFSVAAGAAETWQYEGALLYGTDKQATSPNVEVSTIGAGVRYYFSPLPWAGNYPLAEAPFAERAGYGTLLYLSANAESDFLEKTDVTGWGAEVTLLQPDSDFALHVGYNSMGFKEARIKNTSAKVNIDTDALSIGVGYFVQKYLLLALEHTKNTADYSYQPSSIPSNVLDTTTNQLSAQYLAELTNMSFLAGNLSVANIESSSTGNPTDSNRAISFQGTYYPNKMHGVSLELGQNSGDDTGNEGNWYEIGYQGFMTSTFSVNASYKKFSIKDSSQGSDETSITVGLSIRL